MAGKKMHGKHHTRRRIAKPETIARLLKTELPKQNAPVKAVAITKMSPPPKSLNEAAKQHWHLMVGLLGERLDPLDATALALYCEAWSEWQEAGMELKKKGSGRIIIHPVTKNKYRNPWLDVLKSARREMSTYMALFGLSPHDRAKLGLDNPNGKQPAPNEFSDF